MVPVFVVQKGEPTAARRTIYVPTVGTTDYVTPSTETSGTVSVSVDGATPQVSTASPSKVITGIHKVELPASSVAAVGTRVVTVAGSGLWGQAIVYVVDYEPLSGPSDRLRRLRSSLP